MSKRTTALASSAEASERTGMGAIPFEEGTLFRVWAPNADEVFVMGNFNEWDQRKHPLASEGGGYWSVDVEGVQAGDEYKFVIVNGEDALVRTDPYARLMVNSSGNGIVYDRDAFDWGDHAFQTPPWHELIIYELHIGTFAAGAGGEGEGERPGTFEQAIERLDYLSELGISAVEIMPLAEFAGDYSWGYNPSHPYAVETAYGGPDAFKNFVKEAHARGIAVFLDVVYNHFGPSDLDLWRFDGWSQGDYGGIYFYGDERANTPWGQTRPDYGREEVRRYIRDNVMMWLEDFRLDGLRWDGTVFIRRTNFTGGTDLPDGWQMMQDINREVAEKRPGAMMIAEDLQNEAGVTRPIADGGAGFSTQWDAGFVHPVREALIHGDDGARDLGAVRDAFLHRYADDVLRRVVYTESHDEVANGRARLPYDISKEEPTGWDAKKRSTLGAALVMTAPGVPMLFQGQEFLEDEWFRDTDPLDWSRLERFQGLHDLYRDLIALRLNREGTTRGLTSLRADCIHCNGEALVLAFHRWAEGGPADSTVILVNLSARAFDAYELGFPAEGMWRVRFNGDWDGYDESFGNHPASDVEATADPFDGQPASGKASVGPYTAVIFSQDA